MKPEYLLHEYDTCEEKAEQLDTLIWQTASVIFPITLAGFGYFGLSSDHTLERFVVMAMVAIGSGTLLITWYMLSRTWYAYQSLAYYRMREIEAELGLWHYRYALYIRRVEDRPSLLDQVPDEDRSRFQNLETYNFHFNGIGLHITTKALTAIFLAGWLLMLVREFFLILG